MKYRKKPVEIEAIQWTVDIESEFEIQKMGCNCEMAKHPDYLVIHTLEGPMLCSPWDYIIKGVKGEFYPCKPDIFEMTYEKVEE